MLEASGGQQSAAGPHVRTGAVRMNQHHLNEHAAQDREAEEHSRRHWLSMILCCLPMLAVLALILLGGWGAR